MGQLVLVRHGQASAFTDDYDRLSPLGFQQADWLGEYFATHGPTFDRVVRGSLRRHRETTDGILKVLGFGEAEVDARLDELHYELLEEEFIRATGSDAPSQRSDFLQTFPRLFEAWERGDVGHRSEAFAAFEARVNAGIDEALVPDKNTLVVTSGGVIGVTMRRVLGLDPATTADVLLNIHNASVHRFEYEEGRLRLSLFNASPHLDPEGRAHARTYI